VYEAYFRFPHFKILKARARKWINKSGDEFTTYDVEIKTKKNSCELRFEELWIGQKRYKFHLRREDRKIAGAFGQKEKLCLSVLSEIPAGSPPDEVAKNKKEKLWLGYTFRNKKKYLRINKLFTDSDLQLTGTAFSC
jgi:hypothetical protein